jgi:hypothetical protein
MAVIPPDVEWNHTGASVYRGLWTSYEKLTKAYTMDVTGALATVFDPVTMTGGYYIFIADAWILVGGTGIGVSFVRTVNSKSGPYVQLVPADLGTLTTEEITTLITNLSEELSTRITNEVSTLNDTITNEIATVNETISTLSSTVDTNLSGAVSDLTTAYTTAINNAVSDVTTAYGTAISTAISNVTTAYGTAISNSETSMKTYADQAATDAVDEYREELKTGADEGNYLIMGTTDLEWRAPSYRTLTNLTNSYTIEITQEDMDNQYFTIPDDWEPSRVSEFRITSSGQGLTNGTDYELVEPNEVHWAGKGLEMTIAVGKQYVVTVPLPPLKVRID